MTRMITTILASTALLSAAPVLAESHSDSAQAKNPCTKTQLGDVNRDAGLSQQEIKTLRTTEFDQLDADGNGIVSREEWAECEAQKQAAMQKASISEDGESKFEVGKWSDLNLDVNDKLSAEQWVDKAEKAWEDDQQKAQQVYSTSEDAQSREDYAINVVARFREHDKDNDGMLSKSEYEDTMRGKGFDDAEMNKRFGQLDSDADGEVTRDEYLNAGSWMAKQSSEHNEAEAKHADAAAKRRFDRNDQDGDGMLARPEFANTELGAGLPDDKLEQRFSQMDANGDGSISRDEYQPTATWMNEQNAPSSSGDDMGDSAAADAGDDKSEAAAAESGDADAATPSADGGSAVVPVFYYYIEFL